MKLDEASSKDDNISRENSKGEQDPHIAVKFQRKAEDFSLVEYFAKVQERFYWQKIPVQILNDFKQNLSAHMMYCINEALDVFRHDRKRQGSSSSQVQCISSLPIAFNANERNYSRFAAGRFEIQTELKGNIEHGRAHLLLRKLGPDEVATTLSVLKLSSASQQSIEALLDTYLSRQSHTSQNYYSPSQSTQIQARQPKKFQDSPFKLEYTLEGSGWEGPPTIKSSGSRMYIVPFPKVPPARVSNSFSFHRSSLPIAQYRNNILQNLAYNQLSFVSGKPGSGKTTQVPQYILEDATENNKSVRILCTLPDRLSAICMSDRVAEERGERLGHTVGYQIQLESRVSPCDTLLTYCTSAILLRSLSAPNYSILRNTTHLILDEVQERDSATDMLITCLREIVHKICPQIRIVFMGTDLDVDFLSLFMNGNKPGPYSVLHVQSQFQCATSCFLGTILEILESQTTIGVAEDTPPPSPDGPIAKQLQARRGLPPLTIDTDTGCTSVSPWEELLHGEVFDFNSLLLQPSARDPKVVEYEAQVQARVDYMIACVVTTGDERVLYQFIDLVLSQEVGIDATHSHSELTMLMAYSMKGMGRSVECLLNLGANCTLKSKFGRTAEELARESHHDALAIVLETFGKTYSLASFKPFNLLTKGRFGSFLNTVDENRVDLTLIHSLLHFLHLTQTEMETILVLLPSYDDIFRLKQLIFQNSILSFDAKPFVVHMLHSNVQSGDHKVIFEPSKPDVRKIVLASSLCDYISLENVTHVIDSGKVQERGFSSNGVTSLKTAWITRNTANLRTRWVGNYRPALVFRCYTAEDYSKMEKMRKPQILTAELQGLSLHVQSLLTTEGRIVRFFEAMPNPIPRRAVERSVESLQKIGALDNAEQLTSLGAHLLDFHVEPRFAKALILAVVLRCLDPVLTIVAAVSYGDPFMIPAEPLEQRTAFETKRKLSVDSLSDHMCILKAFQEWEVEKEESREPTFCSKNYIGAGTFEMIYGIRTELLGQLRASGFVRCKGVGDVKSLNYNSGNWAVVKGILVTALFPNLMKVDHGSSSLNNDVIQNARFHPSSCIRAHEMSKPLPSDWILYDEINQSGPLNLVKGCTLVSTAAVGLFGGNFAIDDLVSQSGFAQDSQYIKILPNDELIFKLDNWIEVVGSKTDFELLFTLRAKFRDLVLRQLAKPGSLLTQCEATTMQTIVLLLTCEDQAIGLKEVEGVGNWPRFAGGNLLNAPRCGFEMQ